MATKVKDEDKIKINELYIKYGTYAEVARQTGFSPATVKRYIVPDFVLESEVPKVLFTLEQLPQDVDLVPFVKSENFGEFCKLTKEEEEEIRELWKEMVI